MYNEENIEEIAWVQLVFHSKRSMVGSPVPPRFMSNRRLATCPSAPTPTGETGPTAEETSAELERLAAGLELATVFPL